MIALCIGNKTSWGPITPGKLYDVRCVERSITGNPMVMVENDNGRDFWYSNRNMLLLEEKKDGAEEKR